MYCSFKEVTTFRELKCSEVNIPLRVQPALSDTTTNIQPSHLLSLWDEAGTLAIQGFTSATAGRTIHLCKFGFVLCLETWLVFRLLEGVIHGLEVLVVGDIFDERLDFPQSCFNAFQFLTGTVIGTVNILDLLLKIGVLEQVVFREIVECPCRFLEDSKFCFMLVTLAVNEPDPLLNISDEKDALRRGLSLTSSGRPSGNPLLDAFLGVVLSDGLERVNRS